MPIGTLTKNTQRHESTFMMAPSSGPMTAEMPHTLPKKPEPGRAL